MKGLASSRRVLFDLLKAPSVVLHLRQILPPTIGPLVVTLEVLIAGAWVQRIVSPGSLIAAHLVVVFGYLSLATWASRGLSGDALFRAAMLFLVGPLVGLGLLASVGVRQRKTRTERRSCSEVVTHPLAPADVESAQEDALYAQIVSGRRAIRDPAAAQPMKAAIENGSLTAQQFAIAMISQRYEPAMFTALLSALQSGTPAVRVQAAAVFAKLRERLSNEAKEILRTESDLLAGASRHSGDPSNHLAKRCAYLAGSGFVDVETAQGLRKLADVLNAEEESFAIAPDDSTCPSFSFGGIGLTQATGRYSPALGGG